MSWFDDTVRRWRAQAARRAVAATARAAASATRSAVARAVERVAGEGDDEAEAGEGVDDDADGGDRLGRAARIRAQAQARQAREQDRRPVWDQVTELVGRGSGGGGGSTG